MRSAVVLLRAGIFGWENDLLLLDLIFLQSVCADGVESLIAVKHDVVLLRFAAVAGVRLLASASADGAFLP